MEQPRVRQVATRNFALDERFHCKSEFERRELDKALERAVDEDIDLCASEVTSRPIRCHRCVLTAASPYFDAMFKSGMRESRRGQVELQFSRDLLKSLVQFLYEGRFEITDSTFEQTFLMYHLFEIRNVVTFMAHIMSESVDSDNALELYDTATNFDIPQLRVSIIEFLLETPIFDMQFDQFPIDLVRALLASDELRVEHEGQVMELVLAWVKADAEARSVHQKYLLHFVRLPHLRLAEVDAWREELAGIELLALLTESNDWLADIDVQMLRKRRHMQVHLHAFWAEDSLCEYSFETMRNRNVDQPLWMFDTSQYFIVCSHLGQEPKLDIASCNTDYLSCTSFDGLVVREDWTKRPCFAVGADLHITHHDTLRRVADMRGGWGSPEYDLAFLKVPLAASGLNNRRGRCKRRSFNFEYFKSRICCATEYKGDIIFVVGAFTDADDGPELFFIRICRFNPSIDVHYDDEVDCLTDELELVKDYMPVCCVTTANDKLAVLSAHDIKVFDLGDLSSTTLNLECSISLEFEIGITAWVKESTLYVYLVDRIKDVLDDTEVDEADEERKEPPKMHFISAFSVENNFDKVFQQRLDFPEAQLGYPKDVRAAVIRDQVYIIYKPIPMYTTSPTKSSKNALYIYRFDEVYRSVVRVDEFNILRHAKCDRFPTSGAMYERDLVTFLPTDMVPCEHTTLLDDFCRRCALDEEMAFDPLRLAALRKYLL